MAVPERVEGVPMSRGFTLIEVLAALVICMIVFTAAARLSLFSIRSAGSSETRTFASICGHTKLASLVNMPPEAPELETCWHRDPDNPVVQGGREFYRFWQVADIETGRKVVLYVAWNDGARDGAEDISSEEDLKASGCPTVSYSDIVAGD